MLENQNRTIEGKEEAGGSYGSWMLVENRQRRKSRDLPQIRLDLQDNKKQGSRFRSLTDMEGNVAPIDYSQDIQKNKGPLGCFV